VRQPDCAAQKEFAVMAQNPPHAPELSSRLQKTNEELKNLQNSVKTGMINVKVLMDFRTASERARQASAAVQQWLESQGKGQDPYELMSQVMSQRVEMTTQLVKDVTRDLETLDVDFDTPGLPELNKAVRILAERLKTLFPH
jgi:hypothetical protein